MAVCWPWEINRRSWKTLPLFRVFIFDVPSRKLTQQQNISSWEGFYLKDGRTTVFYLFSIAYYQNEPIAALSPIILLYSLK